MNKIKKERMGLQWGQINELVLFYEVKLFQKLIICAMNLFQLDNTLNTVGWYLEESLKLSGYCLQFQI